MENTRKEFSLDFTKPTRHTRANQPSLVTPILALSTPELHKILGDGSSELTVLTPNGISSVISHPNVLPSPLIPTTVNSNNIRNGNNNCNNMNDNNISNNNNNNIDGNQNLNQKRSDKSRDVDVEKIEKKRERNRLAAKKCRQRKLETIEDLRKTVSDCELRYDRLKSEFDRMLAKKDKEIDELRRDLIEFRKLSRH